MATGDGDDTLSCSPSVEFIGPPWQMFEPGPKKHRTIWLVNSDRKIVRSRHHRLNGQPLFSQIVRLYNVLR